MSSVLTVTFKIHWPPDGWSCCPPSSKLHCGKLFLSACLSSFLSFFFSSSSFFFSLSLF